MKMKEVKPNFAGSADSTVKDVISSVTKGGESKKSPETIVGKIIKKR